ncbi:ExbD/TolR family protein [Pannonibacter indicus]|uniref:Biopolymer transport protein ExbD n=1 Tax=Pannonibacter indicus TaxID=466044 RepID=A0A0K6HYC4_9HYPH|nr:biopolymer transporter ExbD [Pannonibacter indicus]CUA95826.1 Biopolymer transport protein ExbD [Pannonibacter indicus]
MAVRIPLEKTRRKMESTISLINIVFLMLIFFLVAGQLAPPADKQVDLVETTDAESLPPPEALYVRADGTLVFRGQPTDAASYLAANPLPAEGPDSLLKLGVDRNLDAARLVEIVDELYAAGAPAIRVVTRKAGTQ